MDSDLFTRARRAYEFARLRKALRWVIPAALLTLVSARLGGGSAVPVGLLLGALLVGFAWRGRHLGRGLVPGLLAGSLVWGIPTVWAYSLGCCGSTCTISCAGVAGVAGLSAALMVWRSGRSEVPAALAVAGCCAAMGCLPLGVGGLVGLGALAVVGMPAMLPQLRYSET